MVYPDKIILLAYAITRFEGMASGSTSYRNRNPGNLRFYGQESALKDDGHGYAIYPSFTEGIHALLELLLRAATGQSRIYTPEMSLEEFFQHYAPAKDANDPGKYARFAAAIIGVEPTAILAELL